MGGQTARKTISIDPECEFALLLKQAAEECALLDVNGLLYRVEIEAFANYDPERARATLERAAGSLKGVDAKALIAEYRAWRDHDVDV